MKETITMWNNTRMVVLTAITAAVYASILIPFKGFQIIPGFTEVRPAASIPVTFGVLFGPAGAWGSAIGNFIGDLMGMLSIASIPGFIGNFFFALTAYKLWRFLNLRFELNSKFITGLVFISLLSSLCVSFIISTGTMWLDLFPFKVLAPIIAINNFLANLLITPFLLGILYPRVEKWGLLWEEIMQIPSHFEKSEKTYQSGIKIDSSQENGARKEKVKSYLGFALLVSGIIAGWFLTFYLPDIISISSFRITKNLISANFLLLIFAGFYLSK
ncbi:MAG: QueT transporter family protein [Candidatus Aminicenantia bacterium]